MENNPPKSSPSNIPKIITGVFLFCYFGFITIPELSRPISTQFLLWLLLLPFVISALIITGIRGGIGLWREKRQKAVPNPRNKYLVWLASLGLLWLIVSAALANATHFAYAHKKFDPETWKNTSWEDGDFLQLSTRERMLEDLMDNSLPERTKTEIIEMLGQPDETRNVDDEETIYYYTGWNIMEPKCIFMRFDEQGIIKEYDLTICG